MKRFRIKYASMALLLLLGAGAFTTSFFITEANKQTGSAAAKTIFDITTMQEMTAQICANTTTPHSRARATTTTHSNHTGLVPTTILTDTRDNKTYTVSKFADGNCWMTQNLDLGDESTEQNPLVLTPEDSNVSRIFTLPAVQTTANTTWNEGGTTNTTNTKHMYDFSAHSTYSGKAREYGNLYNWYTATAGTGTATMSSGLATDSICPKGWQLPGYSGSKSYADLLNTYSISGNTGVATMQDSPFNFQLAGYYSPGSMLDGQNTYGLYWSASVWNSQFSTALYFWYASLGESIMPRNNSTRASGYAVRCVASGTATSQNTNNSPSILAVGSTIYEGVELQDVKDNYISYLALDDEDGNITDQVTITSDGGYNKSTPGTYTFTLSVTDSDNNTTTKTVKVVVIKKAQDGKDGQDGQNGAQGPAGQNGKSAYELYKENALANNQTPMTESEWIAALSSGFIDPTSADAGRAIYQLAVDAGFTGTIEEWLASLKGAKGDKGDKGDTGAQGPQGPAGQTGKSAYEIYKEDALANNETPMSEPEWINRITNGLIDPNTADAGRSIYQLAVSAGFTGTIEEWLESLKGAKGDTGAQGPSGRDGQDGQNGKSAYELMVENGYTGTLTEWLESLKGANGKSAYELAVEQGYNGTLDQWLADLTNGSGNNSSGNNSGSGNSGNTGGNNSGSGNTGTNGTNGINGTNGTNGTNGSNSTTPKATDTSSSRAVSNPNTATVGKGNPNTADTNPVLLFITAGISVSMLLAMSFTQARRKRK